MLNVTKLIPQGRGLAGVLLKRAAIVELDWLLRQQGALDITDSQGRALAVRLPAGTVLRGGDVLVAEDGSLVRVHAAAQPVLQVRACAEHGSPLDLLRAAYQLGRRQVVLALRADHLTVAADAALADLLRAQHLTVTDAHLAFEPEAGDWTAGGHAHGDVPGHGHALAAAPLPAPAGGRPVGIAVVAPSHVHGPGCGHSH